MSNRYSQTAFLFLLSCIFIGQLSQAEDYPQWRGKNRDGVLDEKGLLQTLPNGPLPRLWSVEVGPGLQWTDRLRGKGLHDGSRTRRRRT